MLWSTTLKANETGVHPWRSMDTRVFPPPSKIAPCRNTRSVRRGARSSVRKKSRPPAVRAGPNWRCCSNFSDAGIRSWSPGWTAWRAALKTSRTLCICSRNAASPSERPSNTQSATGKAFLDMLGVFAEFETNLRRERQQEGIAAAKARGVYRGRKPSIDPVAIHRLHTEEQLGASAIARRLGIGRASVYRALARRDRES